MSRLMDMTTNTKSLLAAAVATLAVAAPAQAQISVDVTALGESAGVALGQVEADPRTGHDHAGAAVDPALDVRALDRSLTPKASVDVSGVTGLLGTTVKRTAGSIKPAVGRTTSTARRTVRSARGTVKRTTGAARGTVAGAKAIADRHVTVQIDPQG